MKMTKKKFGVLALLVLCVLMMAAVPAGAKSKYKSQWVTSKKGYTYYFNKKSEKMTGVKKIGSRYYYFTKSGIQRTGWMKIGKDYYYYNVATKLKGYRVQSKTVNGIKLRSNGKAVVTSSNKAKLDLMVKANKILQNIIKTKGNDKMTKTQKLQAAFDYLRTNVKRQNIGGFNRRNNTWDVWYANYAINTGRGDCYCFGSYFAYLANAAGCKAAAVSSTGHGWAEVYGKVYDPSWALTDRRYSYFKMSYDLSGVGGRPNYRRSRYVVEEI